MATIKHISSKNANYGAAELYLTFQHDEFTNKPVLDDKGRMILRKDFRMETILCGDEDFAIACMRANLKYGKNNRRGDVKSHHYIISFDPRDGTENALTMDKAQQLGVDFCREHFPGHQALVCTHPDGHNHSGNIHVHIVINSLRIEDVPFLPYMDRPCDTQAGMKHRCTASALRYLRSEVMEMCQRENLHQIDLLNGSKNRITEREYHARRRGQQELDEHNQQILPGHCLSVDKFYYKTRNYFSLLNRSQQRNQRTDYHVCLCGECKDHVSKLLTCDFPVDDQRQEIDPCATLTAVDRGTCEISFFTEELQA